MKRRFLVLVTALLCLCLFLCFVSCDNLTEETNEDKEDEGYKYTNDGLILKLNEDKQSYKVIGVDEEKIESSVVIPKSFDNVPVTGISQFAFQGCAGLESVVIPNSITRVEIGVFQDCVGLTSVVIPDSVTSISESMFYGCTGLTSVTIPNGVTSIGKSAFYNCASLKGVKLPDSLTSIGEWAFQGCSGLGNIEIPNRVVSIGEYAFFNCTSLARVIIPNSVRSIGINSFSGCNFLTIYCEAKGQPSEWIDNWNCGYPVEWGYKVEK